VCRTAISFSLELLRPMLAAPCPEVSGLSAGLTAAAGGSTDNPVDVDRCLEVLLDAWHAQRAADLAQLENLVKAVDARSYGSINLQDNFVLLLKQVMISRGRSSSSWSMVYNQANTVQSQPRYKQAVAQAVIPSIGLFPGLLIVLMTRLTTFLLAPS
jgi:hypothetical protein